MYKFSLNQLEADVPSTIQRWYLSISAMTPWVTVFESILSVAEFQTPKTNSHNKPTTHRTHHNTHQQTTTTPTMICIDNWLHHHHHHHLTIIIDNCNCCRCPAARLCTSWWSSNHPAEYDFIIVMPSSGQRRLRHHQLSCHHLANFIIVAIVVPSSGRRRLHHCHHRHAMTTNIEMCQSGGGESVVQSER